MSESMTVEQAIELVRLYKTDNGFHYSTWGQAALVLADEVERLKWNKDIAEGALASVEQERDELRRQLDIILASCGSEHEVQGSVVGTVQNYISSIETDNDELRRQNDDLILKQFDHIGSGNRAVRRIKAAAVREAVDLVQLKKTMYVSKGEIYVHKKSLLDYANQIEGGA